MFLTPIQYLRQSPGAADITTTVVNNMKQQSNEIATLRPQA